MHLCLVGAECEENLSLRYLAAAARQAGHRPEIVPFNTEDELPTVAKRLLEIDPPFVGLSMAFQHRSREFVELVRALRRGGYRGHICCGGHVPTPAWEEILTWVPEIDTVVRHDGEQTLVELLGALDSPERWPAIHGVCCRDAAGRPVAAPPRRQVDDLDELPFPLRVTPHLEHAGVKFAPLVGSRGCYGDCNYCCINSWHRTSNGKRFRLRSPENLAAEMAYLYHDRDVRIFCFHDDTFFMPRPRDTLKRLGALRAALDRQRVGRVGMVGKCRPDGLDLELLRTAREHGVFRLYVGVENGSEAGLLHLGRRHDRQSCFRAMELLREAGVFACFNILLFEPECRLEELDETVELLERFSDFPFNFCRTEIYSGSRYERTLREAGRLRGSFLGYSYEIAEPRAELAYRLMSVCFRGRNFSVNGVANVNTGMGYEAAVVRHFYGALGEPLAREADALIEEINRDTVKRLRELLRFAAECDVDDSAAACDFAEELATAINFRDLELGTRQRDLRQRIKSFGLEHASLALDPPSPTVGTEHEHHLGGA